MPLPVRSLPVLQNWDCQRLHRVLPAVPRSGHRRGAEADRGPGVGEPTRTSRACRCSSATGGWFSAEYRLNHRPDGACVFLGPDNRCRIHAKHGSAAKPLACRIYPFFLVPAGDHWRLGLRFACPSAADNKGRPLADHLAEAAGVRRGCSKADVRHRRRSAPPPPLQAVAGGDVGRPRPVRRRRLEDARRRRGPVERRWRKVLFVVTTLRKARFDGGGDAKKAVTGGRLSECSTCSARRPRTRRRRTRPGCRRRGGSGGWCSGSRWPPSTPARTPARTAARPRARAGRPAALGGDAGSPRGTGRVPRAHAAIPGRHVRRRRTAAARTERRMRSHCSTRWYRVKVGVGAVLRADELRPAGVGRAGVAGR